jgi:hypothetical protein
MQDLGGHDFYRSSPYHLFDTPHFDASHAHPSYCTSRYRSILLFRLARVAVRSRWSSLVGLVTPRPTDQQAVSQEGVLGHSAVLGEPRNPRNGRRALGTKKAEGIFLRLLIEKLAATYSRGSYTTTTIGKTAFDGRVRNGIGSDHSFITTKKLFKEHLFFEDYT